MTHPHPLGVPATNTTCTEITVGHGSDAVALTLHGTHPAAAALTPDNADHLADLLHQQAHAARSTSRPTTLVDVLETAIAAQLDLERWERDGWGTISRDLATGAAPAVTAWLASEQTTPEEA